MRHDVREWSGREVQTGDVVVRPVARGDAVWHVGARWAGGQWGGALVYVRPTHLEVERPQREPQLVRVPDRQLQIRLIAIAMVVTAFFVGRIRRART